MLVFIISNMLSKQQSKIPLIQLVVTGALIIMLSACFDSGDDNGDNRQGGRGDSAYSENSIKLTSLLTDNAQKGRVVSQAAIVPQFDCTNVSDIYRADGTCISPVQASGVIASANFGLIRIAGPSEFEGEGELLSSAAFDLFNPSTFVTNNTLRDAYDSRETYPALSLLSPYYKISFPLSFGMGTVDGIGETKWVTMFLANYGQPFANSTAVNNAKTTCGLSDEEATYSNITDVDIVQDMTFNRGDYLFCVKDNEADVCAASDFMWLDESSKALVATRPASPKQAHALAQYPITCSVDDGRVGFDFGNFGLYAVFNEANQFKLWSDFSHGDASRQWGGADSAPVGDMSLAPASEAEGFISPYYIYYHQNCPNGVCGATTEGADLAVEFIFDTHGMVFVEGMDEVALEAETNIANVLFNISTKSQWSFDQRSKANIVGYSPEDIGAISVKANVTITRAINNPPAGAIVTCPGDSRC